MPTFKMSLVVSVPEPSRRTWHAVVHDLVSFACFTQHTIVLEYYALRNDLNFLRDIHCTCRYHLERGFIGFKDSRFRWFSPNVQMMFRINADTTGVKPIIACVNKQAHALNEALVQRNVDCICSYSKHDELFTQQSHHASSRARVAVVDECNDVGRCA